MTLPEKWLIEISDSLTSKQSVGIDIWGVGWSITADSAKRFKSSIFLRIFAKIIRNESSNSSLWEHLLHMHVNFLKS